MNELYESLEDIQKLLQDKTILLVSSANNNLYRIRGLFFDETEACRNLSWAREDYPDYSWYLVATDFIEPPTLEK